MFSFLDLAPAFVSGSFKPLPVFKTFSHSGTWKGRGTFSLSFLPLHPFWSCFYYFASQLFPRFLIVGRGDEILIHVVTLLPAPILGCLSLSILVPAVMDAVFPNCTIGLESIQFTVFSALLLTLLFSLESYEKDQRHWSCMLQVQVNITAWVTSGRLSPLL